VSSVNEGTLLGHLLMRAHFLGISHHVETRVGMKHHVLTRLQPLGMDGYLVYKLC
jgi:hypothetical protein